MIGTIAHEYLASMVRSRLLLLLSLGCLFFIATSDRCSAQTGWHRDFGKLNKALIGDWPRSSAPASRSMPREQHEFLIDDAYVQPASNNEAASPCRERTKDCGALGCPACKHGECSKRSAANGSHEPASTQANETARAVLEIMDALGRSVIEGTEFEPAPVEQLEEIPAPLSDPSDIREALVKYIHALEAQHVSEASASTETDEGEVWVHDEPVDVKPTADDAVVALRETSRSLDEAASQLEALELYERADQVRSLAQELRHDARRMKTARVVHARRHAMPVVEAAGENARPGASEAARQRLRRLHEAMRHAPGE